MRRVADALAVILTLGLLLGASPGSGNAEEPAEGEGAPGDDSSGGGEVSVQVSEHETLGPYLTDADGNSLYLFLTDAEGNAEGEGDSAEGEGDPAEGEGAPGAEGAPGGASAVGTEQAEREGGRGSGFSTCYDNCAESWPPLLTDGEPRAGEGVDAELLGTTERQDETLQVTYNGWPLYYFSRDFEGYAGGQGVGSTWYLVSPDGQALGLREESEDSEGSEETAGEAADPMVAGALAGRGRSLYEGNCSACHGAQGAGGRGPALAGNANLSDASTVIRQIVNGAPPYMPKFGGQLSNLEIAAVATFIRVAWGNEFGEVTQEEVSNNAAHP